MGGQLFDSGLELGNLGALFADHDSRSRSINPQPDSSGGPLNLDFGNASMVQFLFDETSDLMIFENVVGVLLAGVPSGVPSFNDTQSQTDRIYFLTQGRTSSF